MKQLGRVKMLPAREQVASILRKAILSRELEEGQEITLEGIASQVGVYDTISQMDFPVYARGINPNGPYKNGPGEIGTPVSFGGQLVYPGDIVIGDADGIIFIRPEDAEELIEKTEAVFKMENGIMETMEKDGTYIRPWVDKKLEELGCEYLTK